MSNTEPMPVPRNFELTADHSGSLEVPMELEEAYAMNERVDAMNAAVKEQSIEDRLAEYEQMQELKQRVDALENGKSGRFAGFRERFAARRESMKNKVSGRTKVLGAVALFALGIGTAVALNNDEERVNTGNNTEQTGVGGLTVPAIGMNKNPQTESASAQTPTSTHTIGNAKTVAGLVDRLNIESTADRVSALDKYMGKKNNLELNNTHYKMNAMPVDSNKDEMLAAAGIGSISNTKEGDNYGDDIINSIQGRSANASTGMTDNQEREYLEKFFTTKGENKLTTLSGMGTNDSINPRTHEVGTQPINFAGERILIREVEGMGKVMFKVTRDDDGKICLNVVRQVETPKSNPTGSPKVGTPETAEMITDNPLDKPRVPKDKMTPKTPEEKVQPKEDCTTNPEKPECKKKDEEKKDDGKLPGNPNVPADQDHGTPDVAGSAPAVPGHSPDSVPQQPQDPTPNPIPEGPAPQVPGETNPDPGTDGPATPGTGTDQPAPQLPETKPVG